MYSHIPPLEKHHWEVTRTIANNCYLSKGKIWKHPKAWENNIQLAHASVNYIYFSHGKGCLLFSHYTRVSPITNLFLSTLFPSEVNHWGGKAALFSLWLLSSSVPWEGSPRDPPGVWPCQHLDFRLLASRYEKESTSVVLRQQVCCNLLQKPEEAGM